MAELIKALLMPSGFLLLLAAIALALLVLRKGGRVPLVLLAAATLGTVAFSSGKIACLLLSPLEYRYPMLADAKQYPDARTIVVLTGYAAPDPLMPLSSQINGSSALRLLEAKHLWLNCRACELIVSGNGFAAEAMKTLLVEMGVPDTMITLDTSSPHTDSSALNLRERLDGKPFFLVTSAGHMTRAMGVFLKQGLQPIAAPTDYQLPKDPRAASLAPSPLHLYFSDLAVNEYAGLLWYYLNDRI